jgi:hypothetical protein
MHNTIIDPIMAVATMVVTINRIMVVATMGAAITAEAMVGMAATAPIIAGGTVVTADTDADTAVMVTAGADITMAVGVDITAVGVAGITTITKCERRTGSKIMPLLGFHPGWNRRQFRRNRFYGLA